MGYARPTTPFLDSMAVDSIILENAIAAGVPTYYSFPAIMASRPPLVMGRHAVGLSPDEPTVASTLNQIGYATAAFIAGNPYLTKRFGYAEGFNVFCDFLDDHVVKNIELRGNNKNAIRSRANQWLRGISNSLGLGPVYDELHFRYSQKVAARSPQSLDQMRRFPASDTVVLHACQWVQQCGSDPFFLWLHLMDPHGPYYPPQAALDLMGQQGVTPTRACYLNSCWNRAVCP